MSIYIILLKCTFMCVRYNILDFFMISIPNGLNKHITNLNHLSGDHSPVLLTLGAINGSTSSPSFLSDPVNWKLFQGRLDESRSLNFPLKYPLDIDIEVSKLTKLIQNAISSSTSHTYKKKDQPKSYTSYSLIMTQFYKS